MSHAFDITGRQHDENGNLRNTWSKQAVKAFDERSQCFIEQYSEFAQHGYPAWKSQEAHASFRLPGTNFNGDQAFFVAYAQTWCGKNGAQQKLQTEVHSLDSLRVLGPIQNSNAFAQAFNCPSGSAMNPQRKCAVW
uniref:Peptidase_M13 domain-containing protein n=1 Tax=Ascaris lumbricoides TaxID=6252 RepID=A0A0M3HFA0_ASCLU